MMNAQDHFANAALPVSFSGMAGLYTPVREGVDAAVLFVSPWALEDMCVRKFWRVISERLAGQGIASLRFDLPGTGDSLDPDGFEGGFALWEDAVVEAYRCASPRRKPEPGMIQDLLALWPVDMDRSLLVGDTESDMQAARQAGIRGARYTGGSVLELLQHFIIPSQA